MFERLNLSTVTGKTTIPTSLLRHLAAGVKPRRYRLRDGSVVEVGCTERPPRGATPIS